MAVRALADVDVRLSADGFAEIERAGPGVASGDHDCAPAEGEPAVSVGGGAGEERAGGLDEGGEGLLLGEHLQPGGHGLGGDEAAAEEGEEGEDQRRLLAVSTDLALMPIATATQPTAKETSARKPVGASQARVRRSVGGP